MQRQRSLLLDRLDRNEARIVGRVTASQIASASPA